MLFSTKLQGKSVYWILSKSVFALTVIVSLWAFIYLFKKNQIKNESAGCHMHNSIENGISIPSSNCQIICIHYALMLLEKARIGTNDANDIEKSA